MKTVIFDISSTYQCNFSCSYCHEPHSLTKENNTKLSTEDAFRIVDYIKYLQNTVYPKNEYIIKLSFYGGEPLLNTEAIDTIISNLKSTVAYALITNGFLIDKYINKIRLWSRVSKNNLICNISYDYSLQDKNRCSNTYIKVRDNIKLLHKYNIPVRTITVFHREDLFKLNEVYEDFIDLKKSIPYIKFNFNIDRRKCSSNTINLVELEKVLQSISNSRKLIRYNCDNDPKSEKYHNKIKYFGIGPDCNIYPIGNLAHSDNNTRNTYKICSLYEEFSIIVDKCKNFFESMTYIKPIECINCTTLCKIPKWYFIKNSENDSNEIPDKELCEIQKLIVKYLYSEHD